MTFNYVIVCHSGAGNHSVSKENIYKSVCKKACMAAQVILKDVSVSIPDLIRAAVEAVKVLENDPCTNAGLGSNLTINGKLQCDAAIMCGQSLRFGAVGCLSNIENPILVAEKLLIMQLEEALLAQGRYPPSVLVGRDATEWAINNSMISFFIFLNHNIAQIVIMYYIFLNLNDNLTFLKMLLHYFLITVIRLIAFLMFK